MDFSFTDDQQNIRDAVLKHCSQFNDDYWLERDREGIFPHDFHRSMAESGWLGIAMPEANGGSGLGITEAAIMMQAVAESGGGMTAASSIHGPVFSMQPVQLFGSDEQRQRMIPPVIRGDDLICFAVKANSNKVLLNEIGRFGLGADVVSIGELMRALKAGINIVLMLGKNSLILSDVLAP